MAEHWQISFDDAAEIIGEALRREVVHVCISARQAHQSMLSVGFSENYIEQMLNFYYSIDSGTYCSEYKRSKVNTSATLFHAFVEEVLVPAVNAESRTVGNF